MRQEAHDCLGHAAVGGVVEGVVALSEVVPRRAACAILVRSTIHITYLHLVQLQGRRLRFVPAHHS